MIWLLSIGSLAGAAEIRGRIKLDENLAEAVVVMLDEGAQLSFCDRLGNFQFKEVAAGRHIISINLVGFESYRAEIEVREELYILPDIYLKAREKQLREVVISGNLRETERSESPVPIEIIRASFLQKNPGACLLDAASMVNGVRAQITCNVCMAGEIRINGMEGPYSMVLIDGMPIVSGLSTVYGMSGIPQGLIERLEIVKGPASTLYGSEAMGGIINVITKKPGNVLKAGLEHYSTSWSEHQSDAWLHSPIKEKHAVALGISNYFYNKPIDKNVDGFMDLALQKRISVFNTWKFQTGKGKYLKIAGRYLDENRNGGEMRWTPEYYGSDSIYGESIQTKRWEFIASQQLPINEDVQWQLSYNRHHQQSTYGTTPFNARQQVLFAQAFWSKDIGSRHQFLSGISFRMNDYEDDTPATMDLNHTKISRRSLPGIFLQDEWKLSGRMKMLSGYRLDYDPAHGMVHSPRIAWQWKPLEHHEWRAGYGTGYRVVNLFTEDHAALSGSRDVVVTENLRPERSWSVYAEHRIEKAREKDNLSISNQVFYTYFSNRITGDFDTDPQKIYYRNLDGYAYTAGISSSISYLVNESWSVSAGITYSEVMLAQRNQLGIIEKSQQVYAPRWSGVWQLGYEFQNEAKIDFTANWNGAMRLPVFENDFRPEYSPAVHLINCRVSYPVHKNIQIYAGAKNLLNVTGRNPLMRPFDPFDKNANDPINNPNGYTFDTSYNYAPMQGFRVFGGLSLQL